MQQFHGDSPLCPMLLSLLGGLGSSWKRLSMGKEQACHCCAVVCHRKMAAKGVQVTVLREYHSIVMNQNIFILGNLLSVLGFSAFLKERDDTLPVLSDLP